MGRNIFKRLTVALKLLANNVLPLFFWVFFIFGFDTPDVAIITILSAALHETGHILVGACANSLRIRSHLSGFRIKTSSVGYREDIAILLGGPLANLAVFIVTIPLQGLGGGYFSLLGYINLMTALSNLLPVEGYDGYGIIKKILEGREAYGGLIFLEWISFVLSATLTLLSLWLLLKYGEGYWIFGVFFITMTGKISEFVKRDVFGE